MKGNIDGKDFVQRFAFTSMFSDKIKSFIRDDRFAPVRRLVGEDARVGDQEKDGVVFNRYINIPGSAYPDLGWNTDGLRDMFYLRITTSVHAARNRSWTNSSATIPAVNDIRTMCMG